ncbi:energy-coupling factor ABC transporter ATP-binding protein [Amaricoccus tamworthensis]|uniref:energy-coupling factor ABC transporter ATP-binding protein n=1 Tax=Amaricoccus tamworthensis TaxID=57002 RepID=UPI003C79C328
MALFELRGIRFGYAGRPPALDGVDFTLEAGERVFITGHNGSGKSTLLKIMVGLLMPQSGSVTAFGERRAVDADFNDVRRRAGLVFQDPDDQLFCPTVAEDVAFGPLNLGQSRTEAMRTVEATLARLDLLHLRDRVTHRLSGGEKRLVTLATVLAMEPEVLLLDEPTNALDEENAGRLTEILLALPQAMVLVSHDPHFRRRVATRTLRMKNGVLSGKQPACRNAV